MIMDPGIWVQALVTLSIFTLLIKENPFSRWAEHSLIATTAAIFSITAFRAVIDSGIKPLLAGNIAYIIPLVLSAFIYMRFIPQFRFLNRWSIAFMVGASNGVLLSRNVTTNIVRVLAQYIKPLFGTGNQLVSLGNIVALIGVTTALFYFTFTIMHTGKKGVAASTGKYFIFGFLGYQFSTVMLARLTQVAERFTFLLYDWLALSS